MFPLGPVPSRFLRPEFGCCPQCAGRDLVVGHNGTLWGICTPHRTRWPIEDERAESLVLGATAAENDMHRYSTQLAEPIFPARKPGLRPAQEIIAGVELRTAVQRVLMSFIERGDIGAWYAYAMIHLECVKHVRGDVTVDERFSDTE